MECDAVAAQVYAYLDDQLDPTLVGSIQEHLRGCAACTRLYERQRAMNSVVRQHAHYHTAPKHLARSIRANLRTLAEAEQPRRRAVWGWFASGAAFACVATLAVTLSLVPAGPRGNELEDDLVAAHVRSLMVNHLTDVASSDQHTVKPWFNGKLDMSPPVVDLAAEGYPLIGGRLDYLDRRAVVALVYRRAKHPINLFIWPTKSSDDTAPSVTLTRYGYNLLHWTEGGMTFWAVSDVHLPELEAFQKLIAQATPSAD